MIGEVTVHIESRRETEWNCTLSAEERPNLDLDLRRAPDLPKIVRF